MCFDGDQIWSLRLLMDSRLRLTTRKRVEQNYYPNLVTSSTHMNSHFHLTAGMRVEQNSHPNLGTQLSWTLIFV